MNDKIKIKVDGVTCEGPRGAYITDIASESGIYIPTLCNIPGIKPRGACRICTVKVNGRFMTACSTPAVEGMEIENNIPELNEIRKAIIEVLFVEGNHFCPSCEKSGNCMLQALAYRFQMMVPRYPYEFPVREVEAWHPKIIMDQNRCILCERCIKAIKDDQGRSYFAFHKRGHKLRVHADPEMAGTMTDEKAQEAMDICPVGSILVREKGYVVPIGQRKYDQLPIGSDIETK
ncbi:MAG: 2Fe-2S iron-sulfur cluster-binding protein [Bacteroidales bacterium]|nr:(2Fe-2S)-binding protein [Lentimicrobiaceae bacterium]MDD5695852.1 2Fe-2S iron-sulfur cluster-binding protein [Bacteroidales bacterium]